MGWAMPLLVQSANMIGNPNRKSKTDFRERAIKASVDVTPGENE
jgi:hypothetical protein